MSVFVGAGEREARARFEVSIEGPARKGNGQGEVVCMIGDEYLMDGCWAPKKNVVLSSVVEVPS